jgi:hypothetical protein
MASGGNQRDPRYRGKPAVDPKRKPFYPSAYTYGGSGPSGSRTTNTGYTQGARIGNNWGGYDLPDKIRQAMIDAQKATPANPAADQLQTPTSPYNPGGGGSGGGGRGGGGGGGMNAAKARALAATLFNMDVKPYDMMRQGIATERGQANAYNPNFAQISAPYQANAAAAEATRRAQVAQALQQTTQLGQQLAGQNAGAMATAFGDITRGGGDVSQYMQQANQMGAGVTGNLANQAQFQGQLNASGANGLADYMRSSDLVNQGAAANLANNRGTLLNQLSQQEAAIALQQAQAQQANNQAKQEFLLKYGAA